MFRHGQPRQRYPKPVTGRLVHLAEHHRHFIQYPGLFHFMKEVVPFTGTLTHPCKDRQTRMLFRNVVDEFHDGHGLADTRTAEETDLAALGDRHDEIDDLDASFQNVDCR